MICISVVQSWDIPYFKAIKELLQPLHFCQVFYHLIAIAIVFFLHLFHYHLRVSPDKESPNTKLFG
jgi:dolichyl-phosphate-mannose--protein O-mannosyl transferase